MTHIICRALTCLFWEQGICAADEIEYERGAGCLTFQDIGDLELTAEGEERLESEKDEAPFEQEEEEWAEDTDEWGDDEGMQQ